jgi:hypothetical protein
VKDVKVRNVKDVKVRNEEALTKIRAKMTAKVDEVKAIEKTLTRFRIEIENQLNKKIGGRTNDHTSSTLH